QALQDAGWDDRLRGRVLEHLASLRRWRMGDLAGAITCAREALALAERADDRRLELHAGAYLAHLEAVAGAPRSELMARAVALEETLGASALTIGPRSLLAKELVWQGDLAGARTLLEAVYADIVRTGNENRRPQHCYDLSLVECAAGNLATAA